MLAGRQVDLAQQLVIELGAQIEARDIVAAAAMLELAPQLLQGLLLLLDLLQRALQMAFAVALLGALNPQRHQELTAHRRPRDRELAPPAAQFQLVLAEHRGALGHHGLLNPTHGHHLVRTHQIVVAAADHTSLGAIKQSIQTWTGIDVAAGRQRLDGHQAALRLHQAQQALRSLLLGARPSLPAIGRTGRRAKASCRLAQKLMCP